MNKPGSLSRRGLRPAVLLGLIALLFTWLALPQAALAHPADVYLQATYITVAPTQIVVELKLTPGVLVAPQVLSQLDPDGDQQISEAEGQAYVDAVLRNVVLQVDEEPLALGRHQGRDAPVPHHPGRLWRDSHLHHSQAGGRYDGRAQHLLQEQLCAHRLGLPSQRLCR
jgi:hypothetical protein